MKDTGWFETRDSRPRNKHWTRRVGFVVFYATRMDGPFETKGAIHSECMPGYQKGKYELWIGLHPFNQGLPERRRFSSLSAAKIHADKLIGMMKNRAHDLHGNEDKK